MYRYNTNKNWILQIKFLDVYSRTIILNYEYLVSFIFFLQYNFMTKNVFNEHKSLSKHQNMYVVIYLAYRYMYNIPIYNHLNLHNFFYL